MRLEAFYKVRDGNKGQLICFPYLGGYGNSFYDIVHAMTEEIEIWVANPPGHFGSELELISDINELTSVYYKEISKIIRANCAFFGHSMGGIVSFFLLDKMIFMQDKILPKTLILSACAAPLSYFDKNYSKLSDIDLVQQLKKYGGMPDTVLNNYQLMEVMLPIFRADYSIIESSAKASYHKINIKTHLLWGENDYTETTSAVQLWKNYLIQDFKITPIQGGEHMYIHDKAEEVVEYINQFMNLNTSKV